MNEPTNCLILADGTVLENSSGGYADGQLWCWVKGKTLGECFALFTDESKTREIVVRYSTQQFVYVGMTDMLLIKKDEEESEITIRMAHPNGRRPEIREEPVGLDEITE